MKQSAEQLPSYDTTKRLKYAAALACASLTLTGCIIINVSAGGEGLSWSTPDSSVNAQPQPADRPLSDLKVIKIMQPASEHQKPKYSDAYIVDEIRKGGARLASVTAGELQIPSDIPISIAVVTPHDSVEGKPGEKCFSLDQIYQARADVLKKLDQPLDSRTAVIVNEGDACFTKPDKSQEIAVAWSASQDWVATTIFNKISAPTFDHEIGHQEGLVHTTLLDCLPYKSIVPIARKNIIYSDALQPLLDDTSCDISKGGNGALIQATNNESVMGNMDTAYDDTMNSPYTFYEMNRMAPDVAKSQTIDPSVKETYHLSVMPGSVRMLTIDLPATHPLHVVDPTIKELTIGLNEIGITLHNQHQPATVLRLIAVGHDMTYQYDFVPAAITQVCTEPSEVYRDTTLGVRIIEQTAPNGLDALVTVEPIATE